MLDGDRDLVLTGLQSSLFFETPEEIYARVFRELKPRTALPQLRVEFCCFANADSFIRLEDGRLHVRISDILAGAPAPVMEALAHILLGKLYRKTVPRVYGHRYRMYLNRRDMRRSIDLVRQIRGRKFISGAQGEHYDLDPIFDALNQEYFFGLMAKPHLGWSRRPSRTTLGHYDSSHNAIIISRRLDSPKAPPMIVEYVLYHEMLHLRFPVDLRGVRRRVHTREFREAERNYRHWEQVRELLKKL
jgi:hypothetical protein